MFTSELKGIIAIVAQRIYIAAAKVELANTGSTRATDSGETKLVHWVERKWYTSRGKKKASQKTTAWAIALVLLVFATLPAELILESGIDIKLDCQVVSRDSPNGVCASPWTGWSRVRSSAMALLVSRYTWQDQNWEYVREGSPKELWENEVHSLSRSKIVSQPEFRVRFVAKNCQVTVENCNDCGNMTMVSTENAYGLVAVKSSVLYERNPTGSCSGDVSWSGAVGAGFVFCTDKAVAPMEKLGGDTKRIVTMGVETALTTEEETFLSGIDVGQTSTLQLDPDRTRMYDISCDTDGLSDDDLTEAVTLMRVVDLELNGVRLQEKRGDLSDLIPLNSSDIYKSVFSLKAEDIRSTCAGQAEVYQQCAIFRWKRAIFYCILIFILLIVWLIACWTGAKYKRLELPHDGVTWRKYAYEQIYAISYGKLSGGISASESVASDIVLSTEPMDVPDFAKEHCALSPMTDTPGTRVGKDVHWDATPSEEIQANLKPLAESAGEDEQDGEESICEVSDVLSPIGNEHDSYRSRISAATVPKSTLSQPSLHPKKPRQIVKIDHTAGAVSSKIYLVKKRSKEKKPKS